MRFLPPNDWSTHCYTKQVAYFLRNKDYTEIENVRSTFCRPLTAAFEKTL